jgi:signal transduction histidine kinase
VFRILEDGQNRFWLSSNRGISQVNRKDLNDLADGRIHSIRNQSYGQADGMKSQECNGGFQPAGWRTHDGKMYFPTTQGAVLIDPTRVRRSTLAPPVTLELAILNGRPTNPMMPADIPPGAGSLEFHYSAPSFLAPKRIAFRYRLEGFDPQWVEAGARRAAYYTNIPAGNYSFRVIAANEDGVWNEAGASTTFRLQPHFYNTSLFCALCCIAFFSTIVSLHQLRLRQQNARERDLSARVKERTRELQEPIAARDLAHANLKEAQRLLVDLSRQAGMAEVATGVLHNVGNVLNSVNVSASIASGKIVELRVDKLVAAVALLTQHNEDLPEYLSRDPKGVRVIPYLVKLGRQLEAERQVSLKELEQLRDHVGHIKEIVATQQGVAKACGVIENISLAGVAEAALRIVTPSLERHGIKFEQEVEDLPDFALDKHQVLQILVNLLNNAKESIKERNDAVKLIRIRIHRHGDNRVRVEVRDNGVGLDRQQLTRIFAHGYTTKRDGHGFGLHSGALAAKQMQGSLWAESEGLGCGAAFVLELPLQLQVPVTQKIAA